MARKYTEQTLIIGKHIKRHAVCQLWSIYYKKIWDQMFVSLQCFL